ncbi:hypothetical protein N7509_001788 [Penicillium cosmopolitanum]|uniref:Uncharacterized protein n=1 Tax=Penicillium cosmopolitanum TaxID=1131564 RepID=A0A9W9W853_9EURO|nr:uncharacterized protein N7509_001788 [Penicillium cosmopolitanum]KAJ5407905.1 hypothetical protein N7509_001788 [Penicillium cosmopolitanum]
MWVGVNGGNSMVFLLQKGFRGELRLQQSGESDPDRWGVDEALENLAWDEYFPKEVLDRLEGGRPDVKVFRDVLIEYLERDYAGKNETSPPFSHADYVKATETEQYEEIVEKKAYEGKFCEAILEAITDPVFAEQNYDLSGEYIAKQARRRAFAKISQDFFDSDDYDAGGPRIQVRTLDFETTEAELRLHSQVRQLSRLLNEVMTSPILSDKMGLKERRAFAARLWSLSFWNTSASMP